MRFNSTFSTTIDTDIQQSEQALQTALQQVSTGKRVNLPSDDPAASAALVQSLNQSAISDQYSANATTALTQTQAADEALSSVTTLLNQAITAGTAGAQSTLTSTQKQAYATEVQGLLTSVVAAANTTVSGVSIFGGTVNGTAAFTANSSGGYTYNGNSDINYVAVGDTLKVQTNVPGNQIFQQSGSSVLGSLQQLVTALNSGTSAQIGAATDAVTTALDYVAQQHTIYGNSSNQLTSQETFLSQEQVTLTSQQNSLVGIDTATAAENLAQAETQNSATLEAAAKALPNNLLTYLTTT
jgi:flagellar hook-associated protein 3 FlgL